jgi:hypothetical protein
MNQEISPVDKEQAPLAGAHNLVGISDRGRPIKALAERVAHEGVRHCVVATYTRVDVSNKLTAVGDGMHRCRAPDATHFYSSPSTMVNIWPYW